MIRVVVVDDDPLVRMGLQTIFGSGHDIEVVGTCDGRKAVRTVEKHLPDVLLLDIRMPGADGLTVLRQVRSLPAPPAVAMLTTFDAAEYVGAALLGGAAGFLMKNAAPEQLMYAVRVLSGGGRFLAPEAVEPILETYLSSNRPQEAERRLAILTARERQVLAHLGTGMTNRDIAAAMYLSYGTVKDHVSSLLTKLGGINRVQAAVLAARARVTPDGAGHDRARPPR